jgi:hypothetical protein
LLAGAREFAAWSFVLEPVEVYQIPLVLSEGAYRSGEAALGVTRSILAGAARFAQSRAGMKDLVRALALSGNAGNALSPLSFASSAKDALLFLQDNPESAAWLAALLPVGAQSTVANSAWYESANLAVTAAKEGAVANRTDTAARTVTAGTTAFVQINDDLWAARTLVTAAEFARFTEANPEWRAENAEALAAKGLATQDYLISVETDTRYPAPAVSGVSWYAAEAYCRWLTDQLPASLSDSGRQTALPVEPQWKGVAFSPAVSGSGWKVALPTESQWKDMALVSVVSGVGSIWEWCADPYAPFPAFRADAVIIEEIGSPEKLVRGASWAKPPSERDRERYIREVRGSAPPESATPFVSFRPVLVRGTNATRR